MLAAAVGDEIDAAAAERGQIFDRRHGKRTIHDDRQFMAMGQRDQIIQMSASLDAIPHHANRRGLGSDRVLNLLQCIWRGNRA